MDRTASSIKGVLDNLRVQIQIIDQDIKASEKSKAEFDKILGTYEKKKADLERRIKQNEEWVNNYDTDVGPFAQRYADMTSQIGQIYDKAKDGHARGIDVLKKEFGYHPAFKRPQDTFSAVPFRPK